MNIDLAELIADFFATLKNFFEQFKLLLDSLFGGSTPDDGDEG